MRTTQPTHAAPNNGTTPQTAEEMIVALRGSIARAATEQHGPQLAVVVAPCPRCRKLGFDRPRPAVCSKCSEAVRP